MKIECLVNGYVLPNLLYELIFLDEHEVNIDVQDWHDERVVDEMIGTYILPRFVSFNPDTKIVVRNTLRYLLATKDDASEIWDAIWEASSAPIPTPHGIRHFFKQCHDTLFDNELLPSNDELVNYHVNHDMHIANRLN